MQGSTLAAIIDSENTLNARFGVNNARLDLKSQQSHPSAKSRSRAPSHGAFLKSMSRVINMKGLTFAAITASEKRL